MLSRMMLIQRSEQGIPLRHASAAVLIAGLLALGACSGMTSTEQRTLSGGAIGAGVGAAGTALTGGCVSCGAVIGGAVGAGAGYLFDQHEKKDRY